MLDPIVRDAAEILAHAAEIALSRFDLLPPAESLVLTDEEIMILDAIAMQLQVVGEKTKKIEQLSPGLLKRNGIDPKPVIRMRDFLSHHYEEVDYNAILETCRDYLPVLQQKINALLAKN